MSEVNTEAIIEEEASAPERNVVFEEALEAILFAAGHPVSYSTIARVFDMTPSKIKDKIFEYAIKYNDSLLVNGSSVPRGAGLTLVIGRGEENDVNRVVVDEGYFE